MTRLASRASRRLSDVRRAAQRWGVRDRAFRTYSLAVAGAALEAPAAAAIAAGAPLGAAPVGADPGVVTTATPVEVAS